MRIRSKAEVGKEMERLRIAKGYTKEALAERIGVKVSKIDMLERGETDLPITVFLKLCVALGVEDLDDLIYEKEPLQ